MHYDRDSRLLAIAQGLVAAAELGEGTRPQARSR
ncbi:hypothetical protein SFHH103_04148 (plasmid) [Sinorhizobium fredii HH103]|uniref:Uncharacterized protein n=1 Tax=Sinorhizobium fredii (strain HH103) TaxID=1117943 RepID=G9A385_SINF1|nr:hypothetical protein SFHH103_03341 [Sinorhizobium fredii HH103]CCE98638.1 hypothetical protein SFHH103_04148 [Sinorhizobium fredii HH103]